MKNFKVGDKVKMVGSAEAEFPEYQNKVWTCESSSYLAHSGEEVVFLEGYSGYYMCAYLEEVEQEIICRSYTLRTDTGGWFWPS